MPTDFVELSNQKGNHVEAHGSNKAENNAEPDKEPTWPKKFGRWCRHNDGPVVAAFTGMLVVIAALQACIYTKQLDAFRKDQRPWVKVEIPPISPITGDNPQIMSPDITIINVGKTPAKFPDAHFFVEKLRAEQEPTFKGTEIAHYSTGILFPNSPQQFGGPNGIIYYPIDSQDLTPFYNGDIYYILFATANYRDQFGIQHWTKFCIFQSGSRGTNIPQTRVFKSQKCTDYNSTDDN
jgi:hypothetical protein